MTMMLKSWTIAGALALAAGAGSANANPITYVGDYGSDLTLTITTDGAMGPITATDISSFTVQSSVFPDGSFDSGDGSVIFEPLSFENTGVAIVASASGLSYDFGGDDFDIQFNGTGPTNGNDQLLIQSNGGFVPGSGLYVAGSDDGLDGTLITESGPTLIATPAVSAAPEPAVWSLMISGFALIGAALRMGRRGRSHPVLTAPVLTAAG